jgi:hypothetical protein
MGDTWWTTALQIVGLAVTAIGVLLGVAVATSAARARRAQEKLEGARIEAQGELWRNFGAEAEGIDTAPVGTRICLSAVELTRLIATAKGDSAPPAPGKTWVELLGPSLIALLGVVLAGAGTYFKNEPVDCVGYVNSMEVIRKNGAGTETPNFVTLENVYGSRVRDACGSSQEFFTSTGGFLAPVSSAAVTTVPATTVPAASTVPSTTLPPTVTTT